MRDRLEYRLIYKVDLEKMGSIAVGTTRSIEKRQNGLFRLILNNSKAKIGQY